jgi:hypothetical protein
MKLPRLIVILACPLLLAGFVSTGWADEAEFDETAVIIEINGTDGDVGFHAKFDADAWYNVQMHDPDDRKVFAEKAFGPLKTQGLTENFFESAEPLCVPDPEDEEELVVALAEFLDRFPAGDYILTGKNNENEWLSGSAELTWNIPAAPDIGETDGEEFDSAEDVVLEWAEGDNLGGKCDDQDLVSDGIIPDPADVEIVGWEAVVEPDCDDIEFEPERVFSAQLPADYTSVTVPEEFLQSYLDEDCSEFKFEVGAIEESGNQTFSEGGFEIEE